jgi:hypothetical protein
MPSIYFNNDLSSIEFLPDLDNKMKIINCWLLKEWDIPILMRCLASPRADGQQRVMHMHFLPEPVAQKLLDALKEVCENPDGHMCFLFFIPFKENLCHFFKFYYLY